MIGSFWRGRGHELSVGVGTMLAALGTAVQELQQAFLCDGKLDAITHSCREGDGKRFYPLPYVSWQAISRSHGQVRAHFYSQRCLYRILFKPLMSIALMTRPPAKWKWELKHTRCCWQKKKGRKEKKRKERKEKTIWWHKCLVYLKLLTWRTFWLLPCISQTLWVYYSTDKNQIYLALRALL